MHILLAQTVLPVAAVVCVLVASVCDIRSRRIPNLLTAPAMLVGLTLHLAAGGWREMLSSFAALLGGGLVFLVFHLAGGMGAGDVKLIAAVGCLLGLANAGSLLVFTALAGGVLAIFYAWQRGQLRQTCGNVLALAAHHTEQGLTPHPELNVRNAGTIRLPYALAIAAGCLLTLSAPYCPGAPMNLRRLMPALLGALVLSALFTLWLSKRFSKTASAAPVATHRFVAVNKNVEAGEPLQPAMLQMVDWPASQPLKGSFLKPEEITGRVPVFPLVAGEIVLDRHLAAVGAGTGLTAKIPTGMRAIALRSDEVAGVAGFLLPGTFVDVLVTYHTGNTPGGMNNDLTTSTVLQNARVLAAGQKMEADPDGKANNASVVTLLVTPQDAEKLTLASSLGKILFVLRNGGDRTAVADLSPQTTLPGGAPAAPPQETPRTLLQVRKKTAPLAVAAPHYTVQTISGNKQTEESFEARR